MQSITNNNTLVYSEADLQKNSIRKTKENLITCYAVLIALGMLLSLAIIYPFVYTGLVSTPIFAFLSFGFLDVAAAILWTVYGSEHLCHETFPHTLNIFKQIKIYHNILKISRRELEYLKKESKSMEMDPPLN